MQRYGRREMRVCLTFEKMETHRALYKNYLSGQGEVTKASQMGRDQGALQY